MVLSALVPYAFLLQTLIGIYIYIYIYILVQYMHKISQAVKGLLAQQPCNNTVNMIEQDW